MKNLFRLVVLLLLPIFANTQELPEINYEHILRYHSDIYVQKNCHVKVVETILVYVGGTRIQRGIYREIPTSYLYKGGNVHVGFELLGVKRNGRPEPHHTEFVDNGIRIYAGDEDVYLPTGYCTYEFTYEVSHVLQFHEKFDEMYWNVNGNGWEFTIDSLSANVYYPEGAELVRFKGYTGKYGYTGSSYESDIIQGGVHFAVTRQMVDHEGLTIAVAWNKDQVVYPTAFENLLFFVQSYILWVIGGFGLLLGFLLNMRTWIKYGRDPKPGTIIPLFYPPAAFSPAECVYLKKGGRTSPSLFGSMLVSLAIKGMVQIDVDNGKGLLAKRTYTLKNLNQDPDKTDKPLTELEKSFFQWLMGGHSTFTIQSGTYNSKLKTSQEKLLADVDKKQTDRYFVRNSHLKWRQFRVFLAAAAIGIPCYFIYGGSISVLIVSLVLMLIMNGVFAYLYEQPTADGRKKMDEIAGFEMYLKYADSERIRLQNPPTLNFAHYEENLAYAIALGVAKEWAGQFDPVELNTGYTHHMPYVAGIMIADFSNFGNELNSTISSASTPPSSSGSGSGGGGFSGGGGGGGGGGGW